MSTGNPDDVMHSSLDVRYGFCAMIGTIFFFQILNGLFKTYGIIPNIVANKGEDEIWKWRNLILSWIHAFIAGLWNILCFYYYPDLLNDLILHVTPMTYYLVVFCTGYFLYDFGDMILNKKVFNMWELTLHHIAVISMFFYNTMTMQCIAYNVVAIMAEVNSFFLHTRKLMQMISYPFDSPLYRVNAWLNITSFAVFRGFSLVRITYGMWVEPQRVDRVYYFVLCGSMFIMDVLNPILFWILLRNDFFRKSIGTKSLRPSGRSRKDSGEVCSNGGVHAVDNGVNRNIHVNGSNGHVKSLARIDKDDDSNNNNIMEPNKARPLWQSQAEDLISTTLAYNNCALK